MARLTNEQVYSEIKLVKKDMVYLKDGQAKMQEDITMIKKVLLNPDNGTVSRVNKNTAFRKSTGKVLWSIWVALLGIIGKIIFWN
jgi:outer membrane protein assembly factor BamB